MTRRDELLFVLLILAGYWLIGMHHITSGRAARTGATPNDRSREARP